MTENNPISLSEYKKRYNESLKAEKSWATASTNVKCEKCDGAYHCVNRFNVLASNPSQVNIKCNKCGHDEYLPC